MHCGKRGRGSLCLILAAAFQPLVGAPTPPFVQQGNQVTVAPTMPTYNGAFFNDDTAAYNVLLSPNGFAPLTLNNTGSVLKVGVGSTITVQSHVVLVNTGTADATIDLVGTANASATNQVFNAGTISAPNSIEEGIFFYGFQCGTNLLINSGTISGLSQAIYYDVANGGQNRLVNTGLVSGDYAVNFDGYMGTSNYCSNTGIISGTSEALDFDGSSASFNTLINRGTISSSGASAQAIDYDGFGVKTNTFLNTGMISNPEGLYGLNFDVADVLVSNRFTNAGTIVADGYAVNFDGYEAPANVLVNTGTISGATAILYDGTSTGTDTITLQGGRIEATTHAILITSSAQPVVNVVGRTSLNSDIDNTGGNPGVFNLDLVGVTPAQQAAFNALRGATSGNLVLSPNYQYTWENLTLTGTAISLEQVVDPGLHSLAAAIDNQGQNLPLALDPFYVAATGNPEAALETLSGREVTSAENSVAFNFTTQIQALLTDHAADLAAGTGGIDTAGLQLNDTGRLAMANDLQTQLGVLSLGGTELRSDSKDESKQMQPAASSPRWGGWISGTAEFADEDTTAGNPGYNSTSASPTIGLDYRVMPAFTLGALFNYSNTGVDFAGGSTLDVNTELAGLYGAYAQRGMRVSGMAGYGFTQYDSHRQAFGAIASSSPDGDEITAGVTGAYDFKVGKQLVLSPEIGVDYTHLDVDSFSETGAGAFNLHVGDRGADSLRSHVGGRATATLNCGPVILSPQINAAWYHEFLDNENGVRTSLPGAPALGSFRVNTTPPERDFALVGTGISIVPRCCDDVTIFLNYDAQVGQSDFMANNVDGGVRIDF